MLKVKSLKVLLWVWFPCAIGGIDGFANMNLLGVSFQQLILLLCYLMAMVVWLAGVKSNKLNSFILAWVFTIFFSVLFSGVNSYKTMLLFSLVGGVAWSLLLVRIFTLESLVAQLDRISGFFVLFSLVFILGFPSEALSHVNGDLALDSFYDQKNTFGRFVFFGCFFHILNSFWKNGVRVLSRLDFWGWAVLYGLLLFLSQSKSSIVLLLMAVLVIVGIWFFKGSQKFKNICSVSLMGALVALVILYFVGFVEFSGVGSALDCLIVANNWCIPGTGRYTIWHAVINDVDVNGLKWFGYGYGVYFKELAEINLRGIGLGVFIPNDSHNGYVDVFVSLGYIGIIVLFCILWSAVRGISCLGSREFTFFFVFMFVYVASNFTESYFLKTTNFYPVMFFYLMNYISRYKRSHGIA